MQLKDSTRLIEVSKTRTVDKSEIDFQVGCRNINWHAQVQKPRGVSLHYIVAYLDMDTSMINAPRFPPPTPAILSPSSLLPYSSNHQKKKKKNNAHRSTYLWWQLMPQTFTSASSRLVFSYSMHSSFYFFLQGKCVAVLLQESPKTRTEQENVKQPKMLVICEDIHLPQT